MLDRGEGILDDVFYIEIDINLLQGDSHAWGLGIGEHDELDIGWSFEVVQLVLASPVANKVIVLATQLAHHVPQGEDSAKDQFCIIIRTPFRPSWARKLSMAQSLGIGRGPRRLPA